LDPNAGSSGRLVPLVTAVLSWLHSASERAGGMVRPEDFYSKAVNEMDSKEAFVDLYRWKKASKVQRSTNFFICAHPFLFSPESKRNLLQIENQMEMFNTATAEGVTFNVLEGAFEFDPYWVLEVEREQLLPQTLRKISDAKPNDLRKKLRIVFKGEDGVDAGGVTREFFQLISTQLFDVSSGMWLDQMEDEQITWFNADCFWNDEGYYLVGVLVGLAVYNNVLLDVNFPVAVYRKLLGLPLGLEDVPDRSVQKSLQQLLDYDGDDVEDLFCLNFAIDWMDLGRARTVELRPGGSSIPVSSENKEEYVRLYVKWLLEESIHPQYDAFERGFMKIMEHSTLEFLSPDELELLVVGTRDLDFDALEANTEYDGGYDKDSEVITNFWQFVKSSDTETQLKLLKFATGSSKAPIGGLGKLRFKIQRAGPDSMQLPTSHTCFNTLLLHEYESYDKLASQLGRAIEECEGFGLQ
jgi:ubiquitin-protein ligase E3 A